MDVAADNLNDHLERAATPLTPSQVLQVRDIQRSLLPATGRDFRHARQMLAANGREAYPYMYLT